MKIENKIRLAMREFIGNATSPVILGGHFALANDPEDTTSLIPGIFQDCETLPETSDWMKHHPYMSYFPSETFSMSLELLKECERAKLLLLVNDWQHVKETTVSKHRLRESFYMKNQLPTYFNDLAVKHNVEVMKSILHSPAKATYHGSFYWSETMLRNKFDSHAIYKNCSLKNGCAQEFMPLLDSCESMKVDKMLAFIPATCAYPIISATDEFKNMHDGKMDIMTIFFSNSLSLEKFWDVSVFLNGKEVI